LRGCIDAHGITEKNRTKEPLALLKFLPVPPGAVSATPQKAPFERGDSAQLDLRQGFSSQLSPSASRKSLVSSLTSIS
jgi:hypothetical protein